MYNDYHSFLVKPCLVCGQYNHTSDDCPNLEREYEFMVRDILKDMEDGTTTVKAMWISSTDIMIILERLKKPEWKTRNGSVYNNTIEEVKQEIRRLEKEHLESGRIR